ncbi:MAG: enoyl-CoA hydratase-related protein [Planctomycetota bacterium]|jgi:cyclohexa-1,5-dienecarbonyl-CoA hydratase
MTTVHPKESVRVEELEGGAIWRLYLDAPKANILDGAMVRGLTSVFHRAADAQGLKVICVEGAGSHFSFGASIEEHLPEHVGAMLSSFHGLFRAIVESSVVTLAAVRGQCLGGGLELAVFCNRVFAAPDAKLGQPEIRLGVFAPVASLILPERIGRSAAEDLLLTGRVLSAEEALGMRLVDELAEDPSEAAVEYARTNLLPHSASSLRWALRAARQSFHQHFLEQIPELERLYLEDLVATDDAKEGIVSFIEKRKPRWRNS